VGRLKKSLGDNKKTNPVRGSMWQREILVAVIVSKTREYLVKKRSCPWSRD
jgi:hypothetical protein